MERFILRRYYKQIIPERKAKFMFFMIRSVFIIIFMIFISGQTLGKTPSDNLWEKACDGFIPQRAVIGGKEADGINLYIARAHYKEGIHPGKVRKEFGAAFIPWGGREVHIKCYEVFVGNGKWIMAKDGNIPPNAILAGREMDGTPLYVARAKYRGGIHPGKVRKEFGAAFIPWGDREHKVDLYEVLVQSDSPPKLPPEMPTNAKIINANVNLRDTYPSYSWQTLITFQLKQGVIIDIIKKGERINIIGRKIVANKYEWFEAIYLSESGPKKGWVYGGEKNNLSFIQFDDNKEKKNIPIISSSKTGYSQVARELLSFIDAELSFAGNSTADDTNPTNPFNTMLLGLCNLIIFLSALFSVKRWIFRDSNFYCFLTSLSILLILNIISSTIFSDLLTQVLGS